ncbi:tRNA (5-methylaminomethyl-2-thiouridine)(34)-methyltransferase MnmD [Flavobacterium humi]|uniref:SAM-dependent methyltransferase n=1 Tax=Flavobacterium humi TaxID=2562683 RepID=A0A4Z0L793_9FLAO|nr:tRNA (5-methylaminomethyl-2-thiouridine)(34)-methyltransferase MnmD [Flavobacterium humi]TGD57892.1 SAM-dependent methyltransferase [Flavobacterium humi]
MKREIIKTRDGSTTIHLVDWNESYHSKNGAIREAYHVFIQNGLSLLGEKSVSILEIGFGTGLNAFITFLEAQKNKLTIEYTGVEAYPVEEGEAFAMNYLEELQAVSQEAEFRKMHQCPWEEKTHFNPYFSLTKRRQFFQDIEDKEAFNLIYFDAFGYQVQPELWSTEIFQKMYDSLKNNSILVTYAARGVIKRSMEAVGFVVKKVPGPPGKREMMIAFKNI